MTKDRETGPRLVMPRRRVLVGAVAGAGLFASRGWAQSTEGGEGGEGAAVAALDTQVAFLAELGLFEATHRIVAALYAEGAEDTARDHLEASHHAYYEDLEDRLTARNLPGFKDAAEAFAVAIRSGATPETVATAADAVFAGLAAAHNGATPADEMKAAETLVRIAFDDFSAGVADGVVDAPQEYRDAWGFVEVARGSMAILAASDDTTVAGAGTAALAALTPAAALFPGLNAQTVPNDASILAGAAARIEIAGLRLN
jgi:hypothetical protein